MFICSKIKSSFSNVMSCINLFFRKYPNFKDFIKIGKQIMSQPQQMIRCLICNQLEPKRTLISHISEHVAVGLKPHICRNCDFQTGFEF